VLHAKNTKNFLSTQLLLLFDDNKTGRFSELMMVEILKKTERL
jgi:hypothetical protein